MKSYRKAVFDFGDEQRLKHFVPFPEFYTKGITYEELVNQITLNPEIIAKLNDKPFAKDVLLVFETCLKNSKVKEYSDLYKYNLFLQYLVNVYESFILADGNDVLQKMSLIKNVQFAAMKGKTPIYFKDLEFISRKIAQAQWRRVFKSDKPKLCYLPTDDNSFKTFKLKRKRISKSDQTKYNNLLSKLSISRFLWNVKIDLDKIKPMLDEIYKDYKLEYLSEKLPPIIKKVFGEECTKKTIENLLCATPHEIGQMAVDGRI